jgi:hypothetical protein
LVPEVVVATDFTVASADESRDLSACMISGMGNKLVHRFGVQNK